MDADILFHEFDIWTRRAVLGDAIFPRHITLTRDTITHEYDFYSFYKVNQAMDVYLSVFSMYQIRRRLFDTIFIDIDPDDGLTYPKEKFLSAYEKFYEVKTILDDAGYVYRTYFSGSGFHIYIDFDIVRLEHYRDVVRDFLAELGIIKYVDTHVVGDMMRMARFPLTKNSKTGLYMKRIDPEWSINEIWQYVNDGDAYVDIELTRNNKDIVSKLLEMDKNYVDRYSHHRIHDDYIEHWDLSSMPMCMREGIMRLKYLGELDHYWRLALATFLLRARGYEDTLKLMAYASDYNERKTKYQLDYIVRRRLKVYSCDKMIDMGICPYKDNPKRCPFYPSLNSWLPSWDKILGDGNEGE